MTARNTAYAFRTFQPFGSLKDGSSSAEWNEELALELGERVAVAEFSSLMAQAVLGYPYIYIGECHEHGR